MRLHRFFEISEARDIATFQSRLVRFAEDLDFGLVSATAVTPPHCAVPESTPSSIMNAPDEYDTIFNDVEASLRDPVLRRLNGGSLPVWYDQATYTAAGAGDLWEEQAPWGFRSGIAVSLHMPLGWRFVLGFDRDGQLPAEDAQLLQLLAQLQLAAAHALVAAQELLVARTEAERRPALTARELEVLRWTMSGRTTQAVADRMRISSHTVNFHLRSIFAKLEVTTKSQAVLKAIRFGLIAPPQD